MQLRREKTELLEYALSLREELDALASLHARIESEAKLRQVSERLAEIQARLAEGEAHEFELFKHILHMRGII